MSPENETIVTIAAVIIIIKEVVMPAVYGFMRFLDQRQQERQERRRDGGA